MVRGTTCSMLFYPPNSETVFNFVFWKVILYFRIYFPLKRWDTLDRTQQYSGLNENIPKIFNLIWNTFKLVLFSSGGHIRISCRSFSNFIIISPAPCPGRNAFEGKGGPTSMGWGRPHGWYAEVVLYLCPGENKWSLAEPMVLQWPVHPRWWVDVRAPREYDQPEDLEAKAREE